MVWVCAAHWGKFRPSLKRIGFKFPSPLATNLQERITDFIEAAALRTPDVGMFIRDQALKRFGPVSPGLVVNFVSPPKPNPDGTKMLEASVTPSAPK